MERNRKANRLRDWDYSESGYYFVTVCTHRMEKLFGRIFGEKMELNELSKLAERCWLEIPKHFEGMGWINIK